MSRIYSADELFKASAHMTDFLLPQRTKPVVPAPAPSAGSFTSLLPPATITPGVRRRDRDEVEPPTSLFSAVDFTPKSPPTPRRGPRVIRRLLSRSVLDTPRSRSPSSSPQMNSLSQSPTSSRKPSIASFALDLPPTIESDADASVNVQAPYATTFNLALRTRTPYWGWLELPENKHRLARFGRAMGGSAGWEGAAMDALCGKLHRNLSCRAINGSTLQENHSLHCLPAHSSLT